MHFVLSGIFSRDKKLKKHTVALKRISKDLNDLFYDLPEKSDTECLFVSCLTLRIRDYYEGILFLTSYRIYQSTIPLARALCESLFLLKYVKKHPEYLNEIMSKNERLLHIAKIKADVNDVKLNDLYSSLSDLLHVNPQGVKFTYYQVPFDPRHVIISQIPLDYQRYDEFILRSSIETMTESIEILKEIKNNSR